MSLIGTSHYSKSGTISEKSVSEIASLINIITTDISSVCTPWDMLSFYSALIDKYCNARYRYSRVNYETRYDAWGRVVRGEIWE